MPAKKRTLDEVEAQLAGRAAVGTEGWDSEEPSRGVWGTMVGRAACTWTLPTCPLLPGCTACGSTP